MNRNEIIVIGGDHHNTLAIARCFGRRKVQFKVLVHEDFKNYEELMISHSKYVKEGFVVEHNEDSIKKWLLLNKSEENKQFIFPCSDFAEYVIDNNYSELSQYYYIPGFTNRPGLVCKMMDKYEQKKWADSNNILTAKSWNIVKINGEFAIPDDIIIPCIIKPQVSAFGHKTDIKICNNQEELFREITSFNSSSYKELIVQEFIKKDFEICAVGCVTSAGEVYGGVIKKIRENPPNGGGSLTFAKFIDDVDINKKVNAVLCKLIVDKYNGMYDIEFLACKGKVYLNEINYRHSGNGYALIKSGMESPYIWYIRNKCIEIPQNVGTKNRKIYFLDDFNEFSLYRKKYISLFNFIADFFKSRAHSIIAINDIGVLLFKIKEILKKKRS